MFWFLGKETFSYRALKYYEEYLLCKTQKKYAVWWVDYEFAKWLSFLIDLWWRIDIGQFKAVLINLVQFRLSFLEPEKYLPIFTATFFGQMQSFYNNQFILLLPWQQ